MSDSINIGTAEPVVSLLSLLLSQCFQIYKMVENVKANKERCWQIAKRVKALEELVLTIKQRGSAQISAAVESALRELCGTLDSAMMLMEKFSRTSAFMSFLKSGSHEGKFCKVDKSLTDNFQVLSGALLIEQGDTLHKVYESVRGEKRSHPRPRVCTPEPPPYTEQPLTLSSPTAFSPPPYTAPTMTLSNSTAFSPVPYTAPTMTLSSPTAFSPPPYTAPTMTLSGSTAFSPLPYTAPLLTLSSPTTFSRLSYVAPTMTLSNLVAPAALPFIAPSATMSAMSLYGTMTSNPFSTSIVSNPHTMSIVDLRNLSPFNTSVPTVYNYSPYS